jgi:hypothetical protein
MVTKDWETRVIVNDAAIGQAIASSVLYFGILIADIVQIFRVIDFYAPTAETICNQKNQVMIQKFIFVILVAIFAVFRGVYMALLPGGSMTANPVSVLFVFELPSLIFFFMYTSVLYTWAKMIYRVKSLRFQGFGVKAIFRAFIGVNAAVLLIFAIFIILYYVIPEVKPLPCLRGEATEKVANRFFVNLAYNAFIAFVSVALAVVFLALGVTLIRQMKIAKKRGKVILRMSLAITVSYPPMFMIRSALLLWAGISGGIVPIIVFSLLEIIPSAVMVYYIMPRQGDQLGSSSRGSRGTSSTPGTGTGTGATMRTLAADAEETDNTGTTNTAKGVGSSMTSSGSQLSPSKSHASKSQASKSHASKSQKSVSHASKSVSQGSKSVESVAASATGSVTSSVSE